MKIIIDRIEGEIAVAELPSGKMTNIPKEILPPDAAAGCIVEIRCLTNETKLRANEIKAKMKSIFKEG